MAVLQITLADDLKSRVEARAAEGGYASVEQYLQALLRADLDALGPEDSDLEQLLLERLDSGPGIEFTPDFAERFRREIRERRKSPDGTA